MNTRGIAVENRLSHWARIMQERNDSGMSIRGFCEREGYHENVYYYWQSKLREAVCQELMPVHPEIQSKAVAPSGWPVCEVALEPTVIPACGVDVAAGAISIEIGKSRVIVNPASDAGLLSKVCQVLMSLC